MPDTFAITLIPYIATCIAMELTPGPNMAYLALLSAERGRVAGLAATAGVALGLSILGALAVFGVGPLIAENRVIYEVLRWGGIAYLLWLAWDAWWDAQKDVDSSVVAEPLATYFRRGLLTNLLNPKAVMFYIAVMPNFLPAGQPGVRQSLVLASLYVVVATLVHGAIVIAAGSLQPLLAQPGRRRLLGAVSSLLLAAIACWIAFTTHRDW